MASGSGDALSGVLIRVLRTSDSVHLASGLSDPRGEALVAVPGIPVTTWDEGTEAVLTNEIGVILHAVHDPTGGQPPDPDDLEARHMTLLSSRTNVMLASGRELVLTLTV
jgi:hypothetical protein